jgi:hypothetical protein
MGATFTSGNRQAETQVNDRDNHLTARPLPDAKFREYSLVYCARSPITILGRLPRLQRRDVDDTPLPGRFMQSTGESFMQKRAWLGVSIALLVLMSVACTGLTSPTPTPAPSVCSNTGFPYCMSWTSGLITPKSVGAGYSYSGNIVFTFSPAPPSGTPMTLLFGPGEIIANGVSSGNTASLTVGGSSISCQFVSPTQVNAYFGTPGQAIVNQSVTEAIYTFNWTSSQC